MKIAARVLVLVLSTVIILLAACNDGSGGEPNPSGKSGESEQPSLPPSRGADPFAGVETLTVKPVNYTVDTTKQTLTWTDCMIYSYSYSNETNPPTITVRIDAAAIPQDGGRKLLTCQEYLDFVKTDTEDLSQTLDEITQAPEDEKQKFLNTEDGKNLTLDDLTPEKKEAALRKIVDTKLKYCRTVFNSTYTYEISSNQRNDATATISLRGQYNSQLPWQRQQAGCFYGESSPGLIASIFT